MATTALALFAVGYFEGWLAQRKWRSLSGLRFLAIAMGAAVVGYVIGLAIAPLGGGAQFRGAMKLETYSSLAAFLAHWRALKHATADALAVDELARSAEMDEIIAVLRPEERAALEAANRADCHRAACERRRRATPSRTRRTQARARTSPRGCSRWHNRESR